MSWACLPVLPALLPHLALPLRGGLALGVVVVLELLEFNTCRRAVHRRCFSTIVDESKALYLSAPQKLTVVCSVVRLGHVELPATYITCDSW